MTSETGAGPPSVETALRRFVGAYFVWFMFPLPLTGIPWIGDPLDTWVKGLWARAVPWLSLHFAHLTILGTTMTGSGDRRIDYARVLCCLVFAAATAMAWSLVTRRGDGKREWAWIWIYLRYSLGVIMVIYGAMKVTLGQFSSLNAADLAQPLGDFSPAGLLWAFMGFSPSYQFFGGLAELVGASLLFFRHTATAGALITAGVLANVVMLNFSFDVAVKIDSFHYLLIALAIASPDLRGLFDFFVRRKVAVPAQPVVIFTSRRGQWAGSVLATLFLFLTIAAALRLNYRASFDTIALNGAWRVDSMRIDDEEVSPSESRWSEVVMMPWYLRISRDGAPVMRRVLKTDDATQSFELRAWHGEGRPSERWTWVRPDETHVTVSGVFDGKPLLVQLHRIDTLNMPLTTHQFHWINEVPGID